MAGLDPAIHVLLFIEANKTWMPGTRPGMTERYGSVALYLQLILHHAHRAVRRAGGERRVGFQRG
jgi:hypothetical protein